ncbi:MAG: UbiA family prenyltransferase, partial [Trueperaceae bacterium]
QNIVIGGAAGSFGVLAGWTTTGAPLDATAWLLAALVFLWTPPHFWGLAIARDGDYRAAGVPMLPQTRGVRATSRWIAGYATKILAVSLALVPVAGFGLPYAAIATVAGVAFLALCLRTVRSGDARSALQVFRASGAYLGVLLIAMLLAPPV